MDPSKQTLKDIGLFDMHDRQIATLKGMLCELMGYIQMGVNPPKDFMEQYHSIIQTEQVPTIE